MGLDPKSLFCDIVVMPDIFLLLSSMLLGPEQAAAVDAAPAGWYRAQPVRKRYEVSAPIKRRLGQKTNLPTIYGPQDSSLPLVVIDAGHGGFDPGATSPHNKGQEKNVTLALALAMRDRLVDTGRVRVALTREDDRFLILEDRYQIARRLAADLFISIHADSARNEEARGGTVYTLSEVASDREAQRIATRENRADIIDGVNLGRAQGDVSAILIDLTQRETMAKSADFANLLLREAQGNVPLRSESHRFASFIVLKSPDTPSVLMEAGYLSNEEDTAFLFSKDGQDKIAGSLARAVSVYFARRLVR